MGKKRTVHKEEFKAQVALEAVKGIKKLSELSSEHGVSFLVIAGWSGIVGKSAGII